VESARSIVRIVRFRMLLEVTVFVRSPEVSGGDRLLFESDIRNASGGHETFLVELERALLVGRALERALSTSCAGEAAACRSRDERIARRRAPPSRRAPL
jgi:hypothetical protein